jgi:hypothetical protein
VKVLAAISLHSQIVLAAIVSRMLLPLDCSTKSTYEHSHILKIHNSYIRICESSCCFLAAFSMCSCFDIVSIVTRAVVKWAVVTALTSKAV